MTTLAIIVCVGAFVYLFTGGREGLVDRIGKLGLVMFGAALLVLLAK